ncbi:MAG: hypothetical protein ACLVJ6_09600 [Merdibacter sp.]
MRLFYLEASEARVSMLGGKGAAPAHASGYHGGKINALRLFYHILIFPAMRFTDTRALERPRSSDSMQGRFAAFSPFPAAVNGI